MKTTIESVLHRVPEIDFSTEPNGEVLIHRNGATQRFGRNALGLLDVFCESKTLKQAIQELAPRLKGEEACDEIIFTAMAMLKAGVLQLGPRGTNISRKPYPFGFYDSPGVQIRILRDCQRRRAYLDAIREVVRPGDVVLDLGTGSGILAVAAVQAGARHVYAIEPSGISAMARELFVHNGVLDKITLIEGWSQHLELPERADVLTYDIVGSEPLDMRIPEITRDALARLMKPSPRIIPHGIRFSMALVEVPEQLHEDYVFSSRQISEWSAWYNINFSPFLSCIQSEMIAAYVHPREAASLTWLSEPSPVWEVQFANIDQNRFKSSAKITATRSGRCGGVLGLIDFQLGPTVRFSADPRAAGPDPHWYTPIWFSPAPMHLAAAERMQVEYEYEGRGRSRIVLERLDSRSSAFQERLTDVAV
jgi:protein arginine N-methyltransferase 1